MRVEDLDVDVALDLRPVGDLEHHVLIIVENCAANRHDASTPFQEPGGGSRACRLGKEAVPGHSGAEPTGPARSGRPDDRLREEPGIHSPSAGDMDSGLAASRRSGMTLVSHQGETLMTTLDFAPLLAPGLPPPAAKFNGFPKYNFTGGHNDGEQIPLDSIIKAANDVLTREGRTLATYGLESGPQGYRRLREFLAQKLKRTAGISCNADEILITSGSLQALDLVNGILLARGDTVIIERESYQGALSRLTRLGVNAVGIPLDGDGMRMDALAAALDDLKRRGV